MVCSVLGSFKMIQCDPGHLSKKDLGSVAVKLEPLLSRDLMENQVCYKACRRPECQEL